MPRHSGVLSALVLGAILGLAPNLAADELRIVNWNVTNYDGGRVADFKTAIYGVFQTRSMSPAFIGFHP